MSNTYQFPRNIVWVGGSWSISHDRSVNAKLIVANLIMLTSIVMLAAQIVEQENLATRVFFLFSFLNLVPEF